MDHLGPQALADARQFARDYWEAVARFAGNSGASKLLVAPFDEKFVRNLNRHTSRPVGEAEIIFGHDDGLMSTGKKFYIFTNTGIHSSRIGYVDYQSLSDLQIAYEERRKPDEFAVHNRLMVNGKEAQIEYRYSAGLVMEDFLWRFTTGNYEVDQLVLQLILSPALEGVDSQIARGIPNAVNLLMRLGLESGEQIIVAGSEFIFTNRRTIKNEWSSIKFFRNSDIKHVKVVKYRRNVHTDLVGGVFKFFFDTAKDVVEAVSDQTYNVEIKCNSGESILMMDISAGRMQTIVDGAKLCGIAVKRSD